MASIKPEGEPFINIFVIFFLRNITIGGTNVPAALIAQTVVIKDPLSAVTNWHLPIWYLPFRPITCSFAWHNSYKPISSTLKILVNNYTLSKAAFNKSKNLFTFFLLNPSFLTKDVLVQVFDKLECLFKNEVSHFLPAILKGCFILFLMANCNAILRKSFLVKS